MFFARLTALPGDDVCIIYAPFVHADDYYLFSIIVYSFKVVAQSCRECILPEWPIGRSVITLHDSMLHSPGTNGMTAATDAIVSPHECRNVGAIFAKL